MASELHTLVAKLQGLEETLMDIIVEAASKIAKVTEAKLFVLVEPVAAPRRIFGDPSLTKAFRRRQLMPTKEEEAVGSGENEDSVSNSIALDPVTFKQDSTDLCLYPHSNHDSNNIHDDSFYHQTTLSSPSRHHSNSRKRRSHENSKASAPKLFRTNLVQDEVYVVEDDTEFEGGGGDEPSPPSHGVALSSLSLDHDPIDSKVYQKESFVLNHIVRPCNMFAFLSGNMKAQALAGLNPLDLVTGAPNSKENTAHALMMSLVWDMSKHVVTTAANPPYDYLFFATVADYLTDLLCLAVPAVGVNKKSFIRKNFDRNVRCCLRRRVKTIERKMAIDQ